MMAFENACKNMRLANSSFRLNMLAIEASVDTAYNEMLLFNEKVELKVMKESGTIDDLMYYREEASEGFIVKAKEVITNLIAMLKDFFSEIKDKIISVFAKKDMDVNLDKIEKKIKMNPFIKNAKVKIPDYDKQEIAIKEHYRSLGKMNAKLRSGSDVSPDDLESAKSRFAKRWAVVAAATTTLTIAAAIMLVKKYRASLPSDIGSVEDDMMERCANSKEIVGKITDPQKVALLTRLASEQGKVAKQLAQAKMSKLVGLWSAIKNKIGHAKTSDADVYECSEIDLSEDIDAVDEDCSDDFSNESDQSDGIDAFVDNLDAVSGVDPSDDSDVVDDTTCDLGNPECIDPDNSEDVVGVINPEGSDSDSTLEDASEDGDNGFTEDVDDLLSDIDDLF